LEKDEVMGERRKWSNNNDNEGRRKKRKRTRGVAM
jgi:hypothetical protein